MNKFELFCMIFFVLDAEWDETKDQELGSFLSSANPFLFKDIGSAVPWVYSEFCQMIPEKITVENSYGIALEYIKSLHNNVVSKAFSTIDKKEWIECVNDYLSEEHKGSDLK